TTAADGGRTRCGARQCAEWRPAGGAAAVVRDPLVVPAGRHRDDATVDDAEPGAIDPTGHDEADAARDAAGFYTPAAGHVFCLSAPVMDVMKCVTRGAVAARHAAQ